MITEIGIVAGDIWHYLDAHNLLRSAEPECAEDLDDSIMIGDE